MTSVMVFPLNCANRVVVSSGVSQADRTSVRQIAKTVLDPNITGGPVGLWCVVIM